MVAFCSGPSSNLLSQFPRRASQFPASVYYAEFSVRHITTLWRCGSVANTQPFRRKADIVPQKITNFNESNISAIACGTTHSAFVSDASLYIFGINKYIQADSGANDDKLLPRKVPFDESERITDVACGAYHTAAITDDGRLYTWGWGGSFFSGAGALGLGTRTSTTQPQLVRKFLEMGEKVVKIAAGRQHTLALTASGKLFSTGKGEFGRLGRGSLSDQNSFEEITFFADQHDKLKIVSLCCGYAHSAVLDENGNVWVWGSNSRGQLGLNDSFGDWFSNEITPKLIQPLNDLSYKVKSIASADYHMMALTECGKIFFWGQRDWLVPTLKKFPIDSDGNRAQTHISKVAAGGSRSYYSFAISDSGELFSWGMPSSGCLARIAKGNAMEPTRVAPEVFENEKIAAIACGDYNVLAITTTN